MSQRRVFKLNQNPSDSSFSMRLIKTSRFLIGPILMLFLLFYFLGIVFLSTPHIEAATVTWDGGGTDGDCGGVGTANNWSCGKNWSTDAIPQAADVATFNNTSDKSVTVDANVSITSINMASGYDGTITLGAGVTISLSSTMTIDAGNLDLNGGTVDTAAYTQSAGTVSDTAGGGEVTASGTVGGSGGTWNAGNLVFDGNANQSWCVDIIDTAYYDVTINNSGVAGTGIYCSSVNYQNITHNFYFTDGTIGTETYPSQVNPSVKGDLIVGANASGGGGTISLTGTGAQEINFTGAGAMNSLTINKASGNVTVNAASNPVKVGTTANGTFTITATGTGKFDLNGKTIDVSAGTTTYTNGSLDLNGGTVDTAAYTQSAGTVSDTAGGGEVTASGTVGGSGGTWNAGNLVFDGNANQSWCVDIIDTAYYDVTINNSGVGAGIYCSTPQHQNVTHNFYFTDGTIGTGTYPSQVSPYVKGDLIVGANASGGGGTISLTGTGAQEINFTGAGALSNLTINKASGDVTINAASDTVKIGTTSNGTFTLTATGTGKLDLNGRTMTTSIANISDGTLDLNGGIIDIDTNAATYEWNQTGGTISDTTGGGEVQISTDQAYTGAGTWTGGTLVFDGSANQGWYRGSSTCTALYDVEINNTGANPGVDDIVTVTNGYTDVNITNDLIFTDGTINEDNINVDGDLYVGANASGGNTVIKLDGTGAQEINFTGAGAMPRLTINKASGDTTVNAASNPVKIGATSNGTFTLTATGTGKFDLNGRTMTVGQANIDGGTLDINGGIIDLNSDVSGYEWNQTGGTINDTVGGGEVQISTGVAYTGAGTWTGGTLVFDGSANQGWYRGSSTSTALYDVEINNTGANPGVNDIVDLFTSGWGDANVTHDLYITNGTVNTDAIHVDGNVYIAASASGGSSPLYLDGTGAQEISVVASGILTNSLYIDKVSGLASIAAASINLVVPTSLNITQGIFYTNGKNITVTANTFNNTGTLRVQGGETLTFTRDTNSGIVEYVGDGGATTYTSLNYGNTHWNLTINSTSGTNTFRMGAAQTAVNDLTVTSGTFDVNDFAIPINGNTLINGGTYMSGTAVNTFGNAAIDTVTISSGELKIESDNTLTDIVKTAGTWTNSGGTINYCSAGAISQPLRSDLSPYFDLKVDSAGSTYTLNGAITISHDSNIVAGTMDVSASNYKIYLAGDWSNTDGFNARTGMVYFVGGDGSTQEINGTTSFYDFRARTSGNTSGRTLRFAGSSTTNVTGKWEVAGHRNRLLTLESSNLNNWTINPTAAWAIYVDVARSTNTGVAFCASHSVDEGSPPNINWDFSCTPAVTVSGTIYTAEDKLTNIGVGHNIGLSIAGKPKSTVASGVGGTFSFSLENIAPDNPIAIFIDDDGSYEGNLITQAVTEGANITGLEMYTNKIVLRHETAGPLKNIHLSIGKLAGEDDIHYTASYSSYKEHVDFDDGFEVWVDSGKTYTPEGNVEADDFDIRGTFSPVDNNMTLHGTYYNNGTFTAGTSTVTFDSTAAGETLSGRLNNAVTVSAFYKVAFNGIGGSWTIQDPMLVDADNFTDDFVIGNGTVTLGDGNADNLAIHGGMTIANIDGQTGTFQSFANAEGSSIIFDVNDNATLPSCPNCIIRVGATSGVGQGNFKLRKNTILRLNPRSAATASDTGLETQSTGYLEIQGSQDYSGTDKGTDSSTLRETKICDDLGWANDENNSKVVRMTSGLAFGRVYDTTDTIDSDADCATNTDESIVRADTSSVTEASPTVSGSGPTRTLTLTTQGGIVVANNDHIGRYVHNLVDNTYYKIVDSAQVGAATDTLTIIAEPAADFTLMDTNDDIEVTDGVRDGDTYEVLDYAIVRAESDTCAAAVGAATGESYIRSYAGSENVIRYADICNLGRNLLAYYGMRFETVNGTNPNEGITINKSKIRNSYYGIHTSGSSNNSGSKGISDNIIYTISAYATYIDGGSNNSVSNNRIYSTTLDGVATNTGSNNNTINNNYIYNGANRGISIISGSNNIITQNKTYVHVYDGIYITTNNNIISQNVSFANTSRSGISLSAANNNLISSNYSYANNTANYANIYITGGTKNNLVNNVLYSSTAGSGFVLINTTYNTLMGNQSYANVNGLYALTTAATNNVLINENYGATANTTADINFGAQTHNLRLFNTTLASGTEVTGATTANAYIASFKHDGTASSTKIWNDYSFQTDSTETPQDETTNKFNYADNLWIDSFTPHGFNIGNGAGTEDANLNYAISGAFGGDASVYNYYAVCAIATCTTGTADAWNIYRNGTLLTDKAVTGTLYTDDQTDGGSAPNIQFKIDDAGTDYTTGATYTFTAWKAAADTNTTKSVTMMQDSDTFTVASGKTLQSIGQAGNISAWTKGGGAGTGYNILGAGTFNINYSSFDYLKGASGIDIQTGATVTDLSNTTFDNLVSAGAVDAYINVASTVIGAGLKTFSSDTFNNTGATAEFNVNRTGSDDVGTWDFPSAAGALAGEAFDAKAGVNEADPGMIVWDDSSGTITISGTCKKYDQSTNCANAETIKVAINGTPDLVNTGTTAAGVWSISNVTVNSGDIVTTWVDAVPDDLEANAVTKYDGAGNIFNITMFEDHLSLSSADNPTLTNANISSYDNSVSANEDIFFDVDANNDLTVDTLAQSSQEELYIKSGGTYRPDSASSGNVTTHDLEIVGTLQADNNTIYMGGSWVNSGTFTENGSTVDFNAAAGTETINMGGTGTGKAFWNLTHSGAGTLQPATNALDVNNDVNNSAGTLASNSLAIYIGGSYANTATFTAGTGTVTFDSIGAGETLSGRLNNSVTTSAFYKVAFDGIGGFWTIQDAMYATAANATDTFVVGNGTVTLGDGASDNLQVDGQVKIANNDGQTGTLQTAEVAEGSTITIQMNKDTATTCANCKITVGATTGAGQGNFKLRKNGIIKLMPRNIATGDVGIVAESTGYLEIQGTQDYAGTDKGTDSSALRETKICDDLSWTNDENNGKVVRITNWSSLAFGKIYDITDTIDADTDCATNTDESIVRADNTSVTEASPTVSGSGPTRTLTLTTQDGIVTSDKDHIGRYVHNLVDNTYYKIVDSDQVGAGTDTLTIIAEPAADFTQMDTNDDIEVTDGVRDGDTYEILDYASVTAENGTACDATPGQTGEGYIYSKAGSENILRYADVCNLGRGASPYMGLTFEDVNGANSNEGAIFNKSRYRNNGYSLYFSVNAANNNSTYSKGVTNSAIYSVAGPGLYTQSGTQEFSYNNVYSQTGSNSNILVTNSTGAAIIDHNIIYNGSSNGILISSANNQITNNKVFNNVSYGINADTTPFSANNNFVDSNEIYANNIGLTIEGNNNYVSNNTIHNQTGTNGLLLSNNGANNNIIFNNTVYKNDYGININGNDDNNVFSNNRIYSNSVGYYTGGAQENNFINDDLGGLGVNSTADIYQPGTGTVKMKFFNSNMASTPEVSGAAGWSNGYIISKKHDQTAGITKAWNDYIYPSDSTETPQDETTDKYNYADNSWANSFSPHGYNVGYGAGEEDTDLNYGINVAFGGDGSVYNYYATCILATCTTGTADAWNVYRNGTLLTNKAVTGTLYTDGQVDGGSAPNVQFKIDDVGTDYTMGATYTFTAWKASGDTTTTKSVTMMQDSDTYTVGAGKTLESIGDATHITSWVKGGGAGTGYNIINQGTLNMQYSDVGDLKGPNGIDNQTGSAMTNFSNNTFDNLVDSGASDTYLNVVASVIDAAARTFDSNTFSNTGGGANYSVTRTNNTSGSGNTWNFTNPAGVLGSETKDYEDGYLPLDAPGMVTWGDSSSYMNIAGSSDEGDGGIVKCADNNALLSPSGTISGGAWTLQEVPAITAGHTVTCFIEGAAEADESTAITKYDGAGNIDSMVINRHTLTIGSADNQTLNSTDFSQYPNGTDEDVMQAIAGAVINVDGGSSYTDETLSILTGNTFTVGGAETLNTVNLTNTGTLVSGGASIYNLAGNYANTGTFTASTSVVNFIATDAGHTLSGRLNNAITTSAFYKVSFNGIGGSWTINDAMLVTFTSGDATAALSIGNGTVTLGDGSGDNLEVDGKMTIANTDGQTGTFQTMALTEGSSITIDINNNAAPATCANCMITVGATTGIGQGNLKIRKNTFLRLNARTAAAASDVGLEVESTGYLELMGTQDYTGTSDGTTNETTITDSTKAWALDENNGKVVRITNWGSLAFGKIYDITDTTATTIVRADNSSVTETSPTVSGSGGSRVLTLTTQNGIITANNDHVGRYIHNLADNTYYTIVDSAQVGAGTDTITVIAEPSADLSLMHTNDDIEVTDGVRQNDTYEVLDYAQVSARNTACPTYTVPSNGAAYIYSKAGSQTNFQYADICNLGKMGTEGRFGFDAISVNGANVNEGVTVDKARFRNNDLSVRLNSSPNNSITNNNISGSEGWSVLVNTGSYNDSVTNNIISDGHYSGIALGSAYNNTVTNNILGGVADFGLIYLSGASNNIISNNTIFNNPDDAGIELSSVSNNLISSNKSFGNLLGQYLFPTSNGNQFYANRYYFNDEQGVRMESSSNNTFTSNKIYSNSIGLFDYNGTNQDINGEYGVDGTNSLTDLINMPVNPGKLDIYNTRYTSAGSPRGGYALATGKTPSQVVGLASDGTYKGRFGVFYDDGTYSGALRSSEMAYGYMSFPNLYNYTLAAGKTPADVIGVATDSWNSLKVAFFYNDGTYSVSNNSGSLFTANITAPTVHNYTLAAGKTIGMVVGIQADGFTSGKLAAFYNDGTYSVSTLQWNANADVSMPNLRNYTLPPGKTVANIMGFLDNDWHRGQLGAFYDDGSYSISAAAWDTALDLALTTLYDNTIVGNIISRKDNTTAGGTKSWGNYIFSTNSTETPQDETTDKYNYADNLYIDSFTPHGYNVGYGAGSEDTNLNYAINGAFGGDGSAYTYYATCILTTCTTGTANAWNVYRNGTLLTKKAVTGTLYTDDQVDGGSVPNVQFKIDDVGTDYTKGATYTFTAWKASGDTNTTKSLTMMQDNDTYTVASGQTLESIGDAGHRTSWTRDGGAGTGYNILGTGSFNINYSNFDYLKGPAGIDIQTGSTVTNLANINFDNLVDSATDAFIQVASSVIGAGTKTLDNDSFANTGGGANLNVNRTGSDDIGYWSFTNSVGALSGEAFDGKAGVNEADPGMIRWDDSTGINISGTCKKADGITNCADGEVIKFAINNNLQLQTGLTAGGAWTILSNVFNAGDIITVFIDNVADNLEANAVFKYDGAGDVTGVNISEDGLLIGSDDNQTLTNTDLSTFDNSVSTDEDIFFDVDVLNDLTVDALAQSTQEKLIVKAGNTYRPDAASSGNVTTHDLTNAGTLQADNNTIYIGGSWLNSGTFTANGSTVDFTGGAGTETLTTGGIGAGKLFWNLTHSGAGTLQLNTNELEIDHDINNSAGTLDANNLGIYIGGSYTNSASFTPGNGTVSFDAVAGIETIDSTGAVAGSFNNVDFGTAGGNATWQLSSNFDVNVDLNINDGILAQNGANNINLGDDLTILAPGAYTAGTGIFTFDNAVSGTWLDNTVAKQNLGTVVINNGLVLPKTVILGSSVKATSISVEALQTFNLSAGSYNLEITGFGAGVNRPFKVIGTLTEGNSTVQYTSTNALDVQNENYWNLELVPNGAGGPTYTLGIGLGENLSAENLTIGNGVNAVTVEGSTNDPTINVDGNLLIDTNGIFNSTSGNLNIAGNWTKNGNFAHSNGTVTFDGADASTQIITGDTIFWNLVASTAANTAGRTLRFVGGSAQTVQSPATMSINGAAGKLITLESSNLLNWIINPTAASVSYVNVSLSTNAGVAFCAGFSLDGGGNNNWDIRVGDCAAVPPGGSTPTPTPTPTPTASGTPEPTPTPEETATPVVGETPGETPIPGESGIPIPGTSATPSPAESQGTIGDTFANIINNIGNILDNSYESVKNFLTDPKTKEEAKLLIQASTPTLAASSVGLFVIYVSTVTVNITNILAVMLNVYNYLLSLIGAKKKRRPWGVVYDSRTKSPVNLAIVRIYDGQKKLVETVVTDRQGRFGFLVKPGNYFIVVTKNGYIFTSSYVKIGLLSDDIFSQPYHGEVFEITPKQPVVETDIPIDPKLEVSQKFNFKTFVQNFRNIVFKYLIYLNIISIILIILNYYFLTHKPTDLIFVLAIGLIIVKQVYDRQKMSSWGVVYDSKTKMPIAGVIIRIEDLKYNKVRSTKVTDEQGRYGFLAPAGEYILKIIKPGYNFPSKIVTKKNDAGYSNVYHGEKILKPSDDYVVSQNIALDETNDRTSA